MESSLRSLRSTYCPDRDSSIDPSRVMLGNTVISPTQEHQTNFSLQARASLIFPYMHIHPYSHHPHLLVFVASFSETAPKRALRHISSSGLPPAAARSIRNIAELRRSSQYSPSCPSVTIRFMSCACAARLVPPASVFARPRGGDRPAVSARTLASETPSVRGQVARCAKGFMAVTR